MNRKLLSIILTIIVITLAIFTAHVVLTHQSTTPENYYTPDHYPSYQEINHTLHQIAADNPNIARVFSIGHTWGWDPATQKYDWPKQLWTIEITKNPWQNYTNRPKVYLFWHHAREWIAPAFMMYLINKLITEYQTNETIHWLVEHYEIFITPLSNADGYVIDGNGNLNNLSAGYGPGGWRKDARDNNGDGKFEIVNKWDGTGEGVDPERNWDWHWSAGDNNSNSQTYHGPHPFSEPITLAERNFILNYSIDSICVLHSYTGAILIPWFYTSTHAPHYSFFNALAANMSVRTKIDGSSAWHYSYGQPQRVIDYSAPGTPADWFYGKFNRMGIAIEMEPLSAYVGDGFHPPTGKIAMYCDDLYEGMIYYIEASGSKLKPVNESADQPAPYIVWGHVRGNSGALAGVKVTVENEITGEEISVETDKNGFYMLNLGTMNHTYNSTTPFTITAEGISIAWHANGSGAKELNIAPSGAMSIHTFIVQYSMAILQLRDCT